ncbi:MAG: hypothetical protein MUE88_09570 [Flavobacteriales bacterium]|nr:hypothetical protein [Flavobacteriales bacterium]
MRHRERSPLTGILTAVLLWWGSAVQAQWMVGAQGGPLFFHGVDPKAWAELSQTSGWSAGVHVIQGRRGESGFRFGLDVGQRRYGLYSNNEILHARYDMVSTLAWLSFEMRWSLSRRHRVFFELGPVIGVQLQEERSGHVLQAYNDWGTPRLDEIPDSGVERGTTITDGHWRMGVSIELPLQGHWWAMGGAHIAPGVGNWARGIGMIVVDSQVRLGLMYSLGRGRR